MTPKICHHCELGNHENCDRSVMIPDPGSDAVTVTDCACSLAGHDDSSPIGAYGIREVRDGLMECGTCGRRWAEDITPAGRCPWEHLHSEEEPALPYAGTEGWSGSDASRDRARTDVSSGSAAERQSHIRAILSRSGEEGATWHEIAAALGIHHGQATGSLSSMHKDGQICRLKERRGRSSIYVLPESVGGRETAAQGWGSKTPETPEPRDLGDLRERLQAEIVESAIHPDGWASDARADAYGYSAEEPWIEIVGSVDIGHLVSLIMAEVER